MPRIPYTELGIEFEYNNYYLVAHFRSITTDSHKPKASQQNLQMSLWGSGFSCEAVSYCEQFEANFICLNGC